MIYQPELEVKTVLKLRCYFTESDNNLKRSLSTASLSVFF